MQVDGVLFGRGPLRLRGLRDDPDDFAALVRWLSDDRILAWYGGRDDPDSAEEIVAAYRGHLGSTDPVRPCIIEWAGRAVGYLQFRPVENGDCGGEDPRDAWGVDLLIGEVEQGSQGIGSEVLRGLIEYLCSCEEAKRIVIDPRIDNARAIGCYEKAGFRKLRVLEGHEWHEGELRDHWLMVCDVEVA